MSTVLLSSFMCRSFSNKVNGRKINQAPSKHSFLYMISLNLVMGSSRCVQSFEDLITFELRHIMTIAKTTSFAHSVTNTKSYLTVLEILETSTSALS